MRMGGQRHVAAALPLGKTRYPLYERLGGPRARLDGCEKSRPIGIRSPARSELLYDYTIPARISMMEFWKMKSFRTELE